MKFTELKDFLLRKMKMSHIYQPVLINLLLSKDGFATTKDIAKELLRYDPSQVEYYENVTKNMVGKVLRGHGIIEKRDDGFNLLNMEELTPAEKSELQALCQSKLDEYIGKRGEEIWNHRRTNRGYISGSVKYQVLKRAQGRCELCGISYTERALEVDHIEPKHTGGEDSINNYQALCYSCNASKRHTDNEDFRQLADIYKFREEGCIFCATSERTKIVENNLAYAIYDGFPVTPLHCLIIPKRHFPDYFDIKQAELNATSTLIKELKTYLPKKDPTIRGFNLGVNSGAAAGQSVNHCHIHLIPRRENDVEAPRGGIRNIIPGKGNY
jgi:diadenosine tetraphosphate (Ap4A) HIT family hydrolase